MTDYDPKMIEALAAAAVGGLDNWVLLSLNKQELPRAGIRAALSALPLTPEALNALWRGEAVVVPKEPTVDMIEAHQDECAGDADEASPRRIREAYRAMLAASPYAKKE